MVFCILLGCADFVIFPDKYYVQGRQYKMNSFPGKKYIYLIFAS